MPERAVVGPLFTHAGFQSWFLVCLPERIVAVPKGLWFAITGNKAAALFVRGAVGSAMENAGEAAHVKHVAQLAQLSDTALIAGKGHVCFKANELSAIHYKKKALTSSEIILQRRDGTKVTFGIMNAIDQPAIVKALADRYGVLVKGK